MVQDPVQSVDHVRVRCSAVVVEGFDADDAGVRSYAVVAALSAARVEHDARHVSAMAVQVVTQVQFFANRVVADG